jgi:osmotically-inducible protein OsmY
MKTSRFWGYFAKLGLGAGVTVALGAAPIVAHADPANQAGNATSGAANQAGSAASGAANQAGDEASSAANKASDTANSAADKASDTANSAADKATGVAEPAGATSDDSAITDAVQTKLTGTDTSEIRVDTANGVVTLSGTVHQQATRDHAVKVAKKAKGVKKVKDDIEVVPTEL